MNYKIIQPKDFKTSHWSGGTTTELYIYPEGSDFKSREFDFRLSIATIIINESDFTPLPGVDRTLLLLEGELELIHEGHHSTTLKPLEQDSFSGSWQTKCIGKGKDFNLMTQKCNGTISVVKNDTVIEPDSEHTCIYALNGDARVNGISLKEGSLMVVKKSKKG
ncbi:HutD/Ves family protein [Parvicella tangerina]|uniref:Protein Ves n=1 Tax=Parvicella tangerina TaxID=2829795 RepID=A0A916JNB2_9FLAO|nr:HutD family protein [Parvicella tangerina]CAG5083673.1 Protein Ves [Parvicella tangerina]